MRRDQVVDADLVELRVDTVRDPSAAAALAGRRKPVIFTCRPVWEGGHFAGPEEDRLRILREAQQLGAEYVDVEWKAQFTDIIAARGGQGVVLSSHDFDGVPPDLAARATAMRATGAEIIKIAVTAHRLTDCLKLTGIDRRAGAPAALVAMGEAGLPTRVLATRFGSCWCYAGGVNTVGQIPAARLIDTYSFRKLTSRTALYGVVGRPVSHSLSPAMHNAAFRGAQIDAVYLPLAAADFDDFLAFADAMALKGASVTAPFKVVAYERAHEADPVSRRIGSVNTLKRNGDRWIACNTDVAAFLAPLQRALNVRGQRVTVLGAGGAARAVVEALGSGGAAVTICARSTDRAEAVARMTTSQVTPWPSPAGSWDVLVNATPVGTHPHVEESPLPDGPFDGQLVYDLIYNPPETRLLRDAAAAGCRTVGGLDMLVAQAQRQFEWWTGSRAAERTMRDAARAALQRQEPV